MPRKPDSDAGDVEDATDSDYEAFIFQLDRLFFFLGLVIGFNPALLGRPDARDAGDARDADHFAAAVVAVVVAVVFCCFFFGVPVFFFGRRSDYVP